MTDLSATFQGAQNAAALMQAAMRNDIEAARDLLARGADPSIADDNGNTPLLVAAARGHGVIVDLLLEKNAPVNRINKHGYTPVLSASQTATHVDIVRKLIAHGAELDHAEKDRHETALMKAVMKGHIEIARALIEGGANLDKADKSGRTALMIAEGGVNGEMIQLLREAPQLQSDLLAARVEAERERATHAEAVQNEQRLRKAVRKIRFG